MESLFHFDFPKSLNICFVRFLEGFTSIKMKNDTRTWLIVVTVAIVALAIGYAVGGGITGQSVAVTFDSEIDGGIIKLGWMGPLTGDAASYGLSIKKGVDLALKDSGLKNVKIIYEDSVCEGKEAVSAITKLINIDGVIAVIGDVCSGATLAAAPIAEENGIVMISSSSTSPDITNAGDYIFRTIPTDALQGKFAADVMFSEGNERLAILYGNEDYGVGFNSVLVREFRGTSISSEAFERGSVDVRAQLTKIKEGEPDAIFIISNSPDSAVAALRQIRELGIKAKIYGSEGLKSKDILEAGAAAEGLKVTVPTSPTQEFIDAHIQEYGEEPGPFAAQAYDAFNSLAMAIKQGATTSDEIKDFLYDLEFEGVSGNINFDSDGDVFGNYEVFVVENGKWVKAE